MNKLQIFVCLLIFSASLVGCTRTNPVHSEFCILVGENWEDIDEVVVLLDSFASEREYLRGEKSPNGILYGNSEGSPDFILSATPIGQFGVEVAFSPREPGTFQSERLAIEKYANDFIAEHLDIIPCDEKEGYGKGVIYGFDQIRI
jgi:hypothetical protein